MNASTPLHGTDPVGRPASPRTDSRLDAPVLAFESALRTLFAKPVARRNCPTLPETPAGAQGDMTDAEKVHAGALMRVNHVGEVCAQALYAAQALATENKALQSHFTKASEEEADHLAWTSTRLQELGARPSLLNPLWYGGAFALGLVAGKLGDRVSLGFVQETERQVEAHLQGHLELLPPNDEASRAIVAQMRDEEAAHAAEAHTLGALELPGPVKNLMRSAARLMTTVSYRI